MGLHSHTINLIQFHIIYILYLFIPPIGSKEYDLTQENTPFSLGIYVVAV